jgi:hypothetical protein
VLFGATSAAQVAEDVASLGVFEALDDRQRAQLRAVAGSDGS